MHLQKLHARPSIATQHAPCTHTPHFHRPSPKASPQEVHKQIAPLLGTCCEVKNSLSFSSFMSAAICQHLFVSSYISVVWGRAGRSAGMPEYGLFCVTKSLGQRTGRAHNVPSPFSTCTQKKRRGGAGGLCGRVCVSVGGDAGTA
jgi:hypothetical protein